MCIILFFESSIYSQLVDLCSNNHLLHEDQSECLTISGCCYAVLELSDDLKTGENIQVKNCFKRFKNDQKETCENYEKISKEYGNVLVSCSCFE
jgi:hypothetical protein